MWYPSKRRFHHGTVNGSHQTPQFWTERITIPNNLTSNWTTVWFLFGPSICWNSTQKSMKKNKRSLIQEVADRSVLFDLLVWCWECCLLWTWTDRTSVRCMQRHFLAPTLIIEKEDSKLLAELRPPRVQSVQRWSKRTAWQVLVFG